MSDQERREREQTTVNVDVDAESSVRWALFLLAILILTWGDPDLLDVLQEFCRRYMEN